MAELTFLGAARTVTGSKYLLDVEGTRVLFDCGLFQGLKELRLRNWDEFPVAPSSIKTVVLTHAHLDHVGYLPRLVAQGFKGRAFCTSGTADLCRVVLPDAGRIQEEDARQANRHSYSKHSPALPLFAEVDAHRALTHLQPMGYDRPIEVAPGVTVEFISAGHLLGSSFVLVTLASGKRILFGGDLGRYGRPVLPDPSPARTADVALVESTYGDREHPPDDGGIGLAEVINRTTHRGGKLIIPSFAIGRVEEVIFWIRRLEVEGKIPTLPVYLDSPMAADALKFYAARTEELDASMRPGSRDVKVFATARFQVVSSPQQSKALTASRRPAIVLSASGMATGGRVLHHMAAALPDARNTILFVGFQAAGTRGRKLLEGAAEVKIHGALIPVSAEIARIDSMSAHADRTEILRWLRTFPVPPEQLYLVHGEPPQMDALKQTVASELGWKIATPTHLERVTI